MKDEIQTFGMDDIEMECAKAAGIEAEFAALSKLKSHFRSERNEANATSYLLNPSGNRTLLVHSFDETIPGIEERIKIAQAMINAGIAEQIGVITIPKGSDDFISVENAGGEFCINSATSAAALLSYNMPYPAQKSVKSSGNENLLECECTDAPNDKKLVKTNVISHPQINEFSSRSRGTKDLKHLVEMEGITHVVGRASTQDLGSIDPDMQVDIFLRAMRDRMEIVSRSPAAGLILYTKTEKGVEILPTVGIFDVNPENASGGTELDRVRNMFATIVKETACGSGSAAIGMVRTLASVRNKVLQITQPSGNDFTVRTNYSDGDDSCCHSRIECFAHFVGSVFVNTEKIVAESNQ